MSIKSGKPDAHKYLTGASKPKPAPKRAEPKVERQPKANPPAVAVKGYRKVALG